MQIEPYTEKYDNEIISLILGIQNDENKLVLSLGEQPDLLDIKRCCRLSGGEFRVVLSDDKVIGTIGLMLKARQCAVLKKIFGTKEVLFAGGRSCTVQYAADLCKGCGRSAYHSAPFRCPRVA